MAKIFPGRYTVENNEDLVIFIIGMRFNKWWAIHKWLPVFLAMPPMIKELYADKGIGCLSIENFFSFRTTLMIQYWRSEEDLHNYAKGPKHVKAWNSFNKKVGHKDAVGIYHETYLVSKGRFESIYGNMPKFGLAKAFGLKSISSSTDSARKRFGI